MPRSIRIEPRDGTTIDLGPRNSKLEARYYFLILGSSSLGKENSEANGRGYTPSSMHLHMGQSQFKMTKVRSSR